MTTFERELINNGFEIGISPLLFPEQRIIRCENCGKEEIININDLNKAEKILVKPCQCRTKLVKAVE